MASERDSQQDADEQTEQPDRDEQPEQTNRGEQGEQEGTKAPPREEPVYNDRSKLDFDPDDGLYTGTAVEGGTDIPGPHESVDDVEPEDESGDDEASDDDASDEDDGDEDG